MTTSESKGRFFLQNESIRIDLHNEWNRIDSNRELECSTYMTHIDVINICNVYQKILINPFFVNV